MFNKSKFFMVCCFVHIYLIAILAAGIYFLRAAEVNAD